MQMLPSDPGNLHVQRAICIDQIVKIKNTITKRKAQSRIKILLLKPSFEINSHRLPLNLRNRPQRCIALGKEAQVQ